MIVVVIVGKLLVILLQIQYCLYCLIFHERFRLLSSIPQPGITRVTNLKVDGRKMDMREIATIEETAKKTVK